MILLRMGVSATLHDFLERLNVGQCGYWKRYEERQLNGKNFFDVDQNPLITFKSTIDCRREAAIHIGSKDGACHRRAQSHATTAPPSNAAKHPLSVWEKISTASVDS
jgi:hypothetical protein